MARFIDPTKTRRVLVYEAVGFSLIILMSWLDELLGLSYRLFGGQPHPNWHEAALESLVVIAVWAVVFASTRRLLDRLHGLERFLHVCAWCRRIGHDDEWLPLEEFFARGFDVKTSHGVCPSCAARLMSEIEAMPVEAVRRPG